MKAFIRDLNTLQKPFASLPKKMRYNHFARGGECLMELAREEKRETPGVTSRSEDMAQRLASVCGPAPYSVVWEAFADTRSNPGPDTVRDLLKAFEIDDPWRKMDVHCAGRAEYLRTWLGTFIKKRNECAHTGISAASPGNSELRDYSGNLVLIASAIVAVLEARLGDLAAAA
jgi:hypothetical protein